MKRKFYSWEECMNLREVKVRMAILQAGYGMFFTAAVLPVIGNSERHEMRIKSVFLEKIMLCDLSNNVHLTITSLPN